MELSLEVNVDKISQIGTTKYRNGVVFIASRSKDVDSITATFLQNGVPFYQALGLTQEQCQELVSDTESSFPLYDRGL